MVFESSQKANRKLSRYVKPMPDSLLKHLNPTGMAKPTFAIYNNPNRQCRHQSVIEPRGPSEWAQWATSEIHILLRLWPYVGLDSGAGWSHTVYSLALNSFLLCEASNKQSTEGYQMTGYLMHLQICTFLPHLPRCTSSRFSIGVPCSDPTIAVTSLQDHTYTIYAPPEASCPNSIHL